MALALHEHQAAAEATLAGERADARLHAAVVEVLVEAAPGHEREHRARDRERKSDTRARRRVAQPRAQRFETRTGDAIRLGGFLVSPVEIEEVIRQLPGVADAQVVAVEIAQQTRAVAFVIRQPDQDAVVSETAVVAWVKSRMAGYKVPAQVWFVDAYPVTHSANGDKIQRARLREMALSRLAEQH